MITCFFLHPYDDYILIAGYASCGYEIFQQCPDIDIVIASCGGGQFLAGISSAIKHKKPNCKIYGVEPYGASNMFQSFKGQTPVILDKVDTIAKGLATPHTGRITYDICSRNVDAIILVSDEEIQAALVKCYHTGLAVEPSGCAALAALLYKKVPGIFSVQNSGSIPISNDYIQYSPFVGKICGASLRGLSIVVVITGGNISPDDLAKIVNSQSG
ncbi:unnamed protein product [Gordionus sp. m RMFG-2023]